MGRLTMLDSPCARRKPATAQRRRWRRLRPSGRRIRRDRPRTSDGRRPTPAYLETVYWWAYLRPRAIWVFERQWLVNAILFGNYARLRDAALNALGQRLPGLTLQIACAYGDFTDRLGRRVRAGEGRLDVVDVVPAQIRNMRDKLSAEVPARMLLMDSAALDLPDARYDRAVLFFLLHEQPEAWRRRTLAEALRVVRPGGGSSSSTTRSPMVASVALPDAAGPRASRAVCARPVSRRDRDLPAAVGEVPGLRRRTVFGGLYQEIVIER